MTSSPRTRKKTSTRKNSSATKNTAKDKRFPIVAIGASAGEMLNICDVLFFTFQYATSTENYCHICIEDNGIGFDPKHSERIFEIFERLHHRVNTKERESASRSAERYYRIIMDSLQLLVNPGKEQHSIFISLY